MNLGRRRQRRIVAVLSAAAVLGVGGCGGRTPPPGAESATPAATATPTTTASPSVSATPTVLATPSVSTTVTVPATPRSTPTPGPSSPGPAPVTQQRPGWALDRIDQHQLPLDQKFTTTRQGQGVTVYVVDGLFDVKNKEFGGRASVGLKKGTSCGLEDGINHGLFVAGLVAGRRTGVAQQAKIVSVGSSNGCEGGDGETDAQRTARIVRALDWVAENAHRPAVVNLSLNAVAPAPTIAAAVKRLIAADLTVVASAGNDGGDACQHPPAGLPSVITVAGSTKTDRDAGLNHGTCVDLFAPAEGITSVADPGLDPSRRVTSEGAATSWAAPLVSGAAALYLSAHPTASPAEVRTWLLDHATTGAMKGNRHGSPDRLLFTGGPL